MSRSAVLDTFKRYEDETNERISYGIEHYRKGSFAVTVKDADGNPVKGAKLSLKQKTHEFKYGANIFMLDELETEEKNEKYKDFFADAFNMATLPFYWSDLEPEKGKQRYAKDSPKIYRRPAPDLCIEFCEKHGIEPREHALAYDQWYPEWVKALPVDMIKCELSRRFSEIAERYAGKIRTIEVTNEMFWDFSKASPFYEEDDNVEWCFKEAEKYFPNNQLVINDAPSISWNNQGRNREMYYMLIERAIRNGARIDAIGLQFHMFYRKEQELSATKPFYDPRRLYKIMDRYADFGLPLQLTEITIPAYTYEAEDEELQAELLRRLYSIWFSHPNMEQIIYWNLVDGYAAYAKQGDMESGENYYRGGLVRFDLTPKPAYFALKELFEKTWRTECEAVTDELGVARFKGFFGDYELEALGQKHEIKAIKRLRKNGDGDARIDLVLDR